MNKLFSITAIFALCLTFMSTSVTAQKELSQGVITMELTDVKSEDKAMEAQLAMMKGSTNTLIFNQEKSIMKMDMMGGMIAMTYVTDIASETGFMLFDMMGSKSKVKIGEKEVADRKAEAEKDEVTVTYDKSDTKEIAGYKCYKATISSPNMNGSAITAYVTDAIKVKANIIQGIDPSKIQGFPLEYEIGAQGMSMTYTTKNIEFDVDAAMFDVKTEGFKETTMEEFQKTMGAMGGGMGF